MLPSHLLFYLGMLGSIPFSSCLEREPLGQRSLTDLSLSDRIARYARADPATQSDFWIQRFRTYQSTNNELSLAQQDVLGRVASTVNATSGSPDKDDTAQLQQDAIDAFGIDEASRLFASLHNLDGEKHDDTSAVDNANDGDGDVSRAKDCDCYYDGTWTCLKGYCAALACTHLPDGCGWLGREACTGLCARLP